MVSRAYYGMSEEKLAIQIAIRMVSIPVLGQVARDNNRKKRINL